MDWFISEVFYYFLGAGWSVDCHLMRNCHLQETELNYELLETFEVKFMHFPFVQQSHVDIPYHPIYFRLRDQHSKPIILQHFSQLNSNQNLFPSLVILNRLSCMIRVHRGCVLQEKMSHHFMIFFEIGLDRLYFSCFELVVGD